MTDVWTPQQFDPTKWRAEPGGWHQHSDDVAWFDVPLPGRLHRLTHRCTAHSAGVYGWTVMLRCICGAIREGITAPDAHFRQHNPGDQPLHVKFTEGWRDRNSRYRGTAMLYHPHARLLIDELLGE